jgi:hypothetical protein
MLTFKVTTVGAPEGFILNKEAKLRLNVQKGDSRYLIEAPDGALRMYVHDMQLARHCGLVGLRDKNAVESVLGQAPRV